MTRPARPAPHGARGWLRRVAPAALVLLLAVAAAAPGAPPLSPGELEPPRFTREQMESWIAEGPRFVVVYGTRDPAAAGLLRARGLAIARRLFGGDSGSVFADTAVGAAALRAPLVLVGGPAENEWSRALAPALPVRFAAGSFRWQDREYARSGDALHLVWPNPLDPRRFLLLVAGNSPAALSARGAGFWFGGEDWRIHRDGELARAGVFDQSPRRPWRYDPALDRDRERERERFAAGLAVQRSGGLELRAAPGDPAARAVLTDGARLLARMEGLGLGAARPVVATLHPSLERKGVIVRDTRPEHVAADGEAHLAPVTGRGAFDLWSIAAARLQRSGAAAGSPWLRPAATWLAGRYEGEPLERALSRLYFARLLPTAVDAAQRTDRWRTPLIEEPARALLLRALAESAGPRAGPAVLAWLGPAAPGTLDSLCRRAGVPASRVARRYGELADSLARAGSRPGPRRPRVWRPSEGFQRGVCLAHTVSLERGYLSEACARELVSLRAMGAEWVSLTPFGYLPGPDVPEIRASAEGGPDEETDESLCEALGRARALGMRAWLKPHLWTRGWVGELEFGPSGWPRFFEVYRQFLLHHALLAEREGFDGLFVGHELVSATRADPERWRALIGEVRRVYSGTLSYNANWGQELEAVPFWDALDLVSVSFYYPLADQPETAPAALRARAARALRTLEQVGARWGRPVLVAEVGYAAVPEATVRPWEERPGTVDAAAQLAGYEAFVAASDRADWLAGAFWWKWLSSPGAGPARDGSFTPRGRPAEAVMARALREWEGRPVRVPGR